MQSVEQIAAAPSQPSPGPCGEDEQSGGAVGGRGEGMAVSVSQMRNIGSKEVKLQAALCLKGCPHHHHHMTESSLREIQNCLVITKIKRKKEAAPSFVNPGGRQLQCRIVM